jgi:hypothetical protein
MDSYEDLRRAFEVQGERLRSRRLRRSLLRTVIAMCVLLGVALAVWFISPIHR